MFSSLKKEVTAVVILIIIGITAGFGLYSANNTKDVPTGADAAVVGGVSEKTIVIDAGHGGIDAGASANGVAEKDINLSVAKKLQEIIEKNGGTVVMTRQEDCSTAEEAEGGSWKTADLKKRKNMVEEADAEAFVSIHMNKFPQEKYKGAQVFYSADNTESRILGEEIQKALPIVLQDGNTRVAKKSNGEIFILRGVTVPSVVVECGFLSNKDEAEKLKNEEYQQKIAYAICSGISNYFISTTN